MLRDFAEWVRSPLHLPCISPASPLHLPCIDPDLPCTAEQLEAEGRRPPPLVLVLNKLDLFHTISLGERRGRGIKAVWPEYAEIAVYIVSRRD
jgi:hypothetical protein